MKKLFLAPHDDDQALFGAFTCLRESPLIIIVTDSYIQAERGDPYSKELRATESFHANKILGCECVRLGLPDSTVTEDQIEEALKQFSDYDVVYAPDLQGGNIHHDMVHRAAIKIFGKKVIFYTTYTKTELHTIGEIEIKPTPEELELKSQALDCFRSQLAINLVHFQAIYGKSEWLVKTKLQKLHLGCGRDIKPGWVNLDMTEGADVVADATQGLPFPDSTFDYVYSQDFMEHLPQEKKVFVINEIWRVLKQGAKMEHFIPNAGSRNDFGSPSHLSHWNLQQFEHFDVDSYRYEKDRGYEGFIGGFRKILAEEVNFQQEHQGLMPQSIHIIYEAVK